MSETTPDMGRATPIVRYFDRLAGIGLGLLIVATVLLRFISRTASTLSLAVVALVSLGINVRQFVRGKGYYNRIRGLLAEKALFHEDERQTRTKLNHPERLAVLPYCVGRGLDVGCGNNKTSDNCIGVDILARGSIGTEGGITGGRSEADVCASGDDLHMFSAGEVDFVVARHNLEHYVDVLKTLQEWKRVLRPGGLLIVVLPDERFRNTIALDVTHKHAFTPESYLRYIRALGDFDVVTVADAIPGWSFLAVCRKAA